MNSNLKIDGYLLDSFKIGKNSKFEIESIDYSNGNNWYYNTNENGYCRPAIKCQGVKQKNFAVKKCMLTLTLQDAKPARICS